jgi:hypothetical protein
MADMKTIKLKQALKEMTYGIPFDVSFYTADKKRKVGGDIISLSDTSLTWAVNSSSDAPSSTTSQKAPSHYGNATRNFLLPNGKIRKAHIWLLREFNNKRIVI